MAKKREVYYYKNRLKGLYLDEETCDKLESLMSIDRQGGYITELKNIIYDLSPEEVEIVRDTYSTEFVELRKGTLENHQTVGVAFMYYAKRVILGDSVGLGKTVEVCGLCNMLKEAYGKRKEAFRYLYLTNKTIVGQSRDELIRFTGEYVGIIYGNNGMKNSVKDFCSMYSDYSAPECSYAGTHSILNSVDFQDWFRGFLEENGYPPFDMIVIDESGDILSNNSTQIYENAKFFLGYIDYIVLLNATTFEKALAMFYNQLSFVDDTLLPTKTDFSKKYEIMDYRGPYPRPSGKYKNAEEFRNLVAYRYLARTRKGLDELKVEAGIESADEVNMINCSAERVVVPLSDEQKYLLKTTSMPQMVYDCPSYFNMGIPTTTATTPKMLALLELLSGKLRNEKSVLIYSRYKEAQANIQEMLIEYGFDCEVLNGDSSQKVREATVSKFRNGDIPILITNVQKGLNFGNCNWCIFYTYDPNPNKMVQFEGRMTRSMKIENKHVVVLLSEDKELKTFNSVISDRAKASDIFAGSDYSCVLSLLKEGK